MQQPYQPMGNQSQMTMSQPPQVITSKDLQYLKDQLSWQLNAMKKCAHFAKECQDPQVRQLLDKTGKLHLRHYQMLLKHTQHNNQQHMSHIYQRQNQMQQTNMPKYS